jgi:hypothetical protein
MLPSTIVNAFVDSRGLCMQFNLILLLIVVFITSQVRAAPSYYPLGAGYENPVLRLVFRAKFSSKFPKIGQQGMPNQFLVAHSRLKHIKFPSNKRQIGWEFEPIFKIHRAFLAKQRFPQ